MVARTAREVLRWLEGLYLTYPVVVPKWDLTNGYAYAEILHAYFPHDINMFAFINGRSLNSRLGNWALIKDFVKKKNLPISKEFIDATIHGKDGGAEQLLQQTYEVFTNKKPFLDPSLEENKDFTDHAYQQHLEYFQRSHTSKSIKNNLKISELQTDPSYAYQSKRSLTLFQQSKVDRQASRIDHPDRFGIRPSLAERCLRQPIRSNSNAHEWFTKSFDSRSRSATTTTNKSANTKPLIAKQNSFESKPNKVQSGSIESNDDLVTYKEIILKQHSVPFNDFVQNNDD